MAQIFDGQLNQIKKISVVVPCYNASEYLDRCIESLLLQTMGLGSIEIILVDDASSDRGVTWELITGYEKRYPNNIIAIHLEENLRQGGARNIGISYASGEYLAFCDADDWFALEAFAHLYECAKKFDADVVQYQFRSMDNSSSTLPIWKGAMSQLLELYSEEERKEFLLNEKYSLVNNCWRKLYKMEMIRDNCIQFPEHLIFEEPGFTVPVLMYEKRHYFLDEVLYYYRKSSGSTMTGSWDQHQMDNMKVWIILIEDLKKRGLFCKYYNEIAYLYYAWGFAYNILLLMHKGYTLSTEGMKLLIDVTYGFFPDINENIYLLNEKNYFRILTRTILNMEITDENVSKVNDKLKKYLFS